MSNWKRIISSATVSTCLILAAIIFSSCSGDSGDNNPVGPDASGDNFKTGAAVTYDVSGGGETDISTSLPGATVVAPSGSGGTMTVAPVTESPALSFNATPVQITYSGTDELKIEIERSSGDEVIAFVYGSLENACFDGRTGTTDWWGIPVLSESENAVTFELPMQAQIVGKTVRNMSAPKTVNLAIATLPKGSTEKATLDAIRLSVRQSVNFWLDNLPADLAAEARDQVDGDLSYTISWSNDGNAYQHGDNWVSSNAVFYLTKDVQEDIIAHEVGHYMTHVLCGYDRYEEIYNRFPTDFWGSAVEHGIGDYREGRQDLLEDYAYFSTYIITGALQSSDLSKTPMWTLFKNHKPGDMDYPSHEAYGATMMGTLLRSEHEVYSYDKNNPKVSAPAVNAPLSDVLGIIARGPRDVNELREFIDDYLMDRGTSYQYMLPAIMEPMGWSYNGMGKVIDENGDVVDDAEVRSICQTGEGVYQTTISTKTGSDGTYYLQRIYPGSNILRVYYNAGKDSTDFSYTASWENPTNTMLNLPVLSVTKEKTGATELSGTFSKTQNVAYENGQPVITITGSGTWKVTGKGLSIDQKIDDSIYILCARGSSGKLTFSASAELSGDTTEEWSVQQRYVNHFLKPKLLSPGVVNLHVDDFIQISKSGSDSEISVEYSFPADKYYGAVQMTAVFEVRYSYEVYNKDDDLINSATNQWWMNYGFCHVYISQDY